MKPLAVVFLFAALTGDAAAQASAEAQGIQNQAAVVLAQARRCPQQIDKIAADRFAARASAVIRRTDGQPVARGPSGDYETISAMLVMAANCKMTPCAGRGPAIQPPNCAAFAKTFQSLRINGPSWQINDGLK